AGPGAWGPVYAAVDTLRDLLGGRAVDVDGAVAALDDVAAGLATGAPPAPGTERPAPAPPPPAAPDGPAPVAGDAVRVPRARLERLMADVRELHAGLAGLRLRAAEARRLDRNTGRLGRTLRRYRLRRTAGPARPSAAARPPGSTGSTSSTRWAPCAAGSMPTSTAWSTPLPNWGTASGAWPWCRSAWRWPGSPASCGTPPPPVGRRPGWSWPVRTPRSTARCWRGSPGP